MNRNRSGSIRNITAHLINDKNTSIAETCIIVFIGKSAGNNPSWIYWSCEFFFSTPGTSDPEAGRGGPECQNLAFQRFDPMILCGFLWLIRWTTLENHRTKQMMVYEQMTFFMNNIIFILYFLNRKTDFWNKKKRNRNQNEPEPD